MTKSVSIGFIGLGVMGEPMCRNLCQKLLARAEGKDSSDDVYSICVYDILPEKPAEMSKFGAVVCASIEALAQQSEIVFLSLPGGEQLQQVLMGPKGVFAHAPDGATIVDFSTSPVALTRQMASLATARQFSYIDSPVARTRKAAETGTLAMSVGGDAADVERVRPLLECMASDVLHVGGVGCGQLVKILNNMVLFQTVNALAEAQVLAVRSGLDTATLFEALQQGSANSFALQQHGMLALEPGIFPEQAFSATYAKKDLSYALELAESTDSTVAGARHLDKMFERAIQEGKGEQYWPVIATLLSTDNT